MFMGYGYPVLNFYAPIFYYLAWLLGSVLQLSVWDSTAPPGLSPPWRVPVGCTP